jgi:predicted transcriptional regulator
MGTAMRFNADIVLEELRRARAPLRSVDIWLVVRSETSRSGVQTALVRLEKKGLVKRERRFDQDGDEIASHWSPL